MDSTSPPTAPAGEYKVPTSLASSVRQIQVERSFGNSKKVEYISARGAYSSQAPDSNERVTVFGLKRSPDRGDGSTGSGRIRTMYPSEKTVSVDTFSKCACTSRCRWPSPWGPYPRKTNHPEELFFESSFDRAGNFLVAPGINYVDCRSQNEI